MRATLGLLAADPPSARLLSVEILAAGREGAKRHDAAVEAFASRLLPGLRPKEKDGILVKIPARVDPQADGQLVVIRRRNPRAAILGRANALPRRPRATLLTPPRCGKHEIETGFSPWTGNSPVTETSPFEVTEGPQWRPCPDGRLDPKLSVGSVNPVAGKKSPFVLRLGREDGTQRFSALNLTTPPGLSAYLKGVPARMW
jgi:hypothetical protein